MSSFCEADLKQRGVYGRRVQILCGKTLLYCNVTYKTGIKKLLHVLVKANYKSGERVCRLNLRWRRGPVFGLHLHTSNEQLHNYECYSERVTQSRICGSVYE